MFDDASLQRYSRQLLLPEIGEHGQEALCATYAAVSGGCERACEVCMDYLDRAGVITPAWPGLEVVVGEDLFVKELAGSAELYEAGAWLAGSLAAVEAIKRIVQIGRAAGLVTSFSLATETD